MRTVGVEEEMLLVDIRDGRAHSVQGQLVLRPALHTTRGTEVSGAVEGEFQQQQLETQTAPVRQLEDLAHEVRQWRSEAAARAKEAGCRVAAMGTPPLPVSFAPVRGERYDWILERYQLIARQHLSCGLHVHVSIDSPEEGVGVLDRVRVWLPVLLALSANSPFWQGEDTGFASWRTQLMGRWPSSGPSELFGTVDAYREVVAAMVETSVLLDEAMIYFDARMSHHYPTVEVRVADVCSRVEETVLIAALSRALVETAGAEWSAGQAPPNVRQTTLRLAAFQASRHGTSQLLLDPLTGQPEPAWQVVDSLLEHVRPGLEKHDDLDRVTQSLAVIRDEGTGAARQRETHERTGQLVDVVARAVRETASQE
jgi:carboxylate-amine ligase